MAAKQSLKNLILVLIFLGSSQVMAIAPWCDDPQQLCQTQQVSAARELREQFREVVRFAQFRVRNARSFSVGGWCPTLAAETGILSFGEQSRVLIEKELYTDSRKQLTQDLFLRAKEMMLVYLERNRPRENQQGDRAKIRSVTLEYGPPPGIETVLDWNLYYDFVNNRIYVGGPILLSEKLPEAMIFALLHELSHALDPVSSFVLKDTRKAGGFSFVTFDAGKYSFRDQLECLSSMTKARDTGCLSGALKTNPGRAEILDLLRGNPYFNLVSDAFPQCQKDQMAETFADWLATEVIAATSDFSLESVALHFCPMTTGDEDSLGSHMPPSSRLKLLLIAHPQLRLRGLCESFGPVGYCH